MSISQDLITLNNIKQDIKDSIIGKGIIITNEDTFSSYASKIDSITAGTSEPPVFVDSYIRPIDWLPLPELQPDQEKFVGLHAIFSDSLNKIALTASADYTIDWGDGIIENYKYGNLAIHTYNYQNLPDSALCSRGYKQVIVSIIPQPTKSLSIIDLTPQTTSSGLYKRFATGWLDITIAGANLFNIRIGSDAGFIQGNLEKFSFIGTNNLSSTMNSLFCDCCSLKSVSMTTPLKTQTFESLFKNCISLEEAPFIDTSNATSMQSMFYGCSSLAKVPLYNTSKVAYMQDMFNGCKVLKGVPLFDTSSVVNFNNLFAGCSLLREVPLFDTSKVTKMSATFMNCGSLTKAPMLDTSRVTEMSNIFSSCISLDEIPLYDTGQVTNIGSAFASCIKIKSIPNFNTANVTWMYGLFSGCINLENVPLLDMSKATNISWMFSNCIKLKEIPIFNTSKVTDMSYLFNCCKYLTEVPLLDTLLVTSCGGMFSQCISLSNIPAYNLSNITSNYGFVDTTGAILRFQPTGIKINLDLTNANLNRQELINVFNNLGSGVVSKTLTIKGTIGLPQLTADDKLIATNKGWVLSI